MNIFVASSWIAFIFSIVIAFFVSRNAQDKSKKNAFIPIVVFAGIWCLFPAVAALCKSTEQALFFTKLVYVAAIFTGPAFLAFGLSIAEIQKRVFKVDVSTLSYLAGAVIFLPLLGTDLLITGVLRFKPYFALAVGPLYPLFIIFFRINVFVFFFSISICFS